MEELLNSLNRSQRRAVYSRTNQT